MPLPKHQGKVCVLSSLNQGEASASLRTEALGGGGDPAGGAKVAR